jgi:hypothetical protein
MRTKLSGDFSNWRNVVFRIDNDYIRPGFSVAFFATRGVGDGNHEEGTLFAIGVVFVAFEETAREWVAIVP